MVVASPFLKFDAERVKMIRVRLEMTQQSFAEYLGVDVETVRRWEQGVNQPTKGPLIGKLLAAEKKAESS